jgi:DNA-directed RNA polymerase specialized sigma24 family protein
MVRKYNLPEQVSDLEIGLSGRDDPDYELALELQHAQPGDTGLLESLIEMYGGEIYRLAAVLIDKDDNGTPPSDQICRLVEETFAYATYNSNQFWGKDNVRDWLLSITLDLYRNKRRRPMFKPWTGKAESDSQTWKNFERPISMDQGTAMAWAQVNALPEVQRISVILYYVFERDILDIARLLDIREEQIAVELYAARDKLFAASMHPSQAWQSNHTWTHHQIQDLLSGRLKNNSELRAALEEHLDECEECRSYHEELEGQDDQLQKTLQGQWPFQNLSSEEVGTLYKASQSRLTGAQLRFGLIQPLQIFFWMGLFILIAIGIAWQITRSGYLVEEINSLAFLSTPTPTPSVYQTYPIGKYVYDIAVEDLDGDSYPDLAVSDYGGDALRVFLNNGDGTLKKGVNYATSEGPRGVVAADLNGDAHTDLTVAYSAKHKIGKLSVLLNRGNGTFETPIEYTAGYDAWWVFVADLDGDSDLDLGRALAEKDLGGGQILVWLNKGNGAFEAQQHYVTGPGFIPGLVSVGDLNGDSYPDLAVTFYPDPRVRVLLNNGNATFAAPVDYEVGFGPGRVTIADLDGDSYSDLAVPSIYNTLSVLFNNGEGSFQNRMAYEVGKNVRAVSAVDINGDTALDLLVSDYTGYKIDVLLNDGEGLFRPADGYTNLSAYFPVSVTDLDGDSRPELLAFDPQRLSVRPIKDGD